MSQINSAPVIDSNYSLKARFHNECGTEHSFSLIIDLSALKSNRALSEAKKNQQNKQKTPFGARNGNKLL